MRVVSPYVVAELEVLDELAGGAYELLTMGLGDLVA